MEAHINDAHHKPNRPMGDPSSKQLSTPPVSLQPQDKFCESVMLHMETWVAKRIFGPTQPSIPLESLNGKIWLTVDTVDSGNVAEISIYGEPSLKCRMKNVLLHMEANHKKDVQRAWTMKELEEFLKKRSPNSNHPQEPRQEALAD